ncbi:MAG TPA: energy transducer TonB [Bryobacteraceae bacterium]|nr:energy transducer TonB [Bryobacteraceae bacterium]
MRSSPPQPGLECFAQMATPDYPEAALHKDVTGTVWTHITLTPQATVSKIDAQVVSAYSDGEKLLVPAVEKAIHASTFKPDCAGKTVFVAFRYEEDGQAVADPHPQFRKEPPNVAWIESQPPLNTAAAHQVTARR